MNSWFPITSVDGISITHTSDYFLRNRNIEVDFQQERSPTARSTLFRRHSCGTSRYRTDGYTFQRND